MKIANMTLVAFSCALLLGGCSTNLSIEPSFEAQPRVGLSLAPPILAAVEDGRAKQDTKHTAILKADLSRVYGAALEWTDYFEKTPPGRVSVRVRIVMLGSTFGSRMISSAAFSEAIGSAQVSATGPWGPVVGTVSSQQSALSGAIAGEGWWNGAAWVDLEVQDNRGPKTISFTLPIAAEHRESNTWGYISGEKAAKAAWDRVVVQLTRAMDAVARTVRDQQTK